MRAIIHGRSAGTPLDGSRVSHHFVVDSIFRPSAHQNMPPLFSIVNAFSASTRAASPAAPRLARLRAAWGGMYGSKYGRISWRAAENGLFCLKGKSSSTF